MMSTLWIGCPDADFWDQLTCNHQGHPKNSYLQMYDKRGSFFID